MLLRNCRCFDVFACDSVPESLEFGDLQAPEMSQEVETSSSGPVVNTMHAILIHVMPIHMHVRYRNEPKLTSSL